MKTVWIYERGDALKVFATDDDAREWFKDNDPEGVAFKHEVSRAENERAVNQLSRRLAMIANSMTEAMSQGGSGSISVTPENRDDIIGAIAHLTLR